MIADNGRRNLRVASPSNGATIGEVPVQGADEVRAAVARARAAQAGWAARSFAERARVMHRAAALLRQRQDAYMDVIMRETGRSRFETVMMEIFPALDSLTWYAVNAEKVLAEKRPGMHLLKTKKLRIVYRPLGVVGIITPWNGPFILGLNPSVQALMAGNAVIVKPSEVTPFSGSLVAELFRDAGLPDGVLQVVTGDGETGAALVEAGVDKISFTGSVATGRKVGEACGRALIPCTLELGGKDAMIVCADADLERAAGGAVFGGFMNTGQFCCSTERVYVVEEVAEEFTRKVVDKTRALRQAATGEYDLGPMIWPRQLDIVERQVADALARGATALTGGKRNRALGELFYEATVLVDVNHDMAIMKEETFGPVLPIARVGGEEEAIRLANDSDYGLSGTVWSRDQERAVAIARRLETGSVCINESSVTYGAVEAPFGGRKASGVGQVNGEIGLRGYCHALPIVIDRFGTKEEHVWYPYTADKEQVLQKIMRWVWGTPIGKWMS
ncbi:MAG TPA: aldehyde dehydrogenase family protein [Kofleriaceae bacterium]|nr:aldehyde dehydrogenase family protein [Kofleriaceae bacterium]